MEEERKLDKNQIIGFVIIGILLIGFSWWNSKNAEEAALNAPQTEQVESESSNTQELQENNSSSATAETESTVVTGDSATQFLASQVYALESDLLSLEFAGKGAQVNKVYLKEFQTYDSLPLNIVNHNTIQNFGIGNDIQSADMVFNGRIEKTDSTQTLYLTSTNSNGSFTQWYRLTNGSYQLEAGIEGQDVNIQSGSNLSLKYAQDGIRMEKSRENEMRVTTIYYWESEDQNHDYLSATSSDDEDEINNVKWVGHKQQFFSTIIDAANGFKTVKVGQAELTDDKYTKRMASALLFNDKVGSNFSVNYNIYYGPNDYSILKTYDSGYDQIIDFGWGIFGWISRYVVIPIFNWLDNYGLNYGIIIFVMALLIKMVLFPLTYQSYKSMAKMRVLKPEIDELNEKNKNADPMVKQQATMALYKEAGVNPLGGCIPQLVQLPILIAMFRFFPASIELRQKSFLWATDLSTYDDIITWSTDIPLLGNHLSVFTLLMAISTLMYTIMNQSMTAQNNQMPQMKYIMYAMPVMMFFWFNDYASGLSYYYLVANIITFTQQWVIRKTVDDEAIHAKLKANKSNPKKRSKFQEQLEEMAKKQGRRGQRQAKK